jgi:hypothetical protein
VACKEVGTTEQSYYRYRKEYGGLGVDQAMDFTLSPLSSTRAAVISGSISKVMRLSSGSREPRFCLRTRNLLSNRDSF